MAGELFEFCDLMVEAHRITRTLDGLTHRDGAKATSVALSDGKRMYGRLLDYRRNAPMTALEAHALDSAREQLQARLKFFGEGM